MPGNLNKIVRSWIRLQEAGLKHVWKLIDEYAGGGGGMK